MLSMFKKFLPHAAALLLATGCAGTAWADDMKDNDPLEGFNRAMFGFNHVVDTILLRPIAAGYRYVAPQMVRNHIGNFSDNLYEPVNAINALLQGDVQQGMTSFWRFVINTTIGFGGINDVASEAGLQYRSEDFGQTLGVWGVDSGPYLVLPLLGPSSVRDGTGRIADIFLDPINYYVDFWTAAGIDAGQAVVTRERYLDPIDDIYASSLDPYASFRSIYQQRRAAQIANHDRATEETLQ